MSQLNSFLSPPRCRGRNLFVGSLMLLCLLCFSEQPAQARCVHTGVVYSCITPGGPTMMMTCYGTGAARTCMDFAGKYIVVGQHWRMQLVEDTASTDGSMMLVPTEDVSFDQQLETAIAANAAANLPKKITGTATTPKPPPPAH